MYRSAEVAFGALDFEGLGYITEKHFLESIVVRERIPNDVEQIKQYFRENNLFNGPTNGINFDEFKKNFFPHLYLVQDDPDDAEDKQAYAHRNQLDNHREEQPALIEQRLLKLESKLKTKFSNCYESVRKAFLALDTDYDGYITVEDILKYFGNEKELNYRDL